MGEGGGEGHATGANPSPPEVFISYASQDATLADTVVAALESHGLRCWIAPRDVTPGTFYGDEIVHAIDAAKASVLILSQNAVTSPHVLREVERAASKRHAVISLRIDKAPLPAGLEYFLNTSQWLDASSGDTARALPKLVSAVQVAIQAPAVTPLGVPTANVPLPAVSARLPRRIALVATSVIGLGLAVFAGDRLWLSRHQAIAPAAPAPAASAPTEKSVAVLPFVDMSEKKDQEYFSDGLSEELIDMLAKVPDLRVPARTSSFYFKGKQVTIQDIAKALGVADVLEGSIRKSGSHLRITAQLVRADNGYHLWSETYDRQLDDIFKVQDEIASAVVKALKISLMGQSLSESAGTQNTEAYNLFLQGKSMWRQANETADFERVAEYLRKAVEADPQFADAWALRARALLAQASSNPVRDPKLIEEARRAATQALKLNSALPGPHFAYAEILFGVDLDLRSSAVQIDQALELAPNSAEALGYAALLAMYRGQFDKALELAQKSIAIDPVDPSMYVALSQIYYFAGKYPEALAANRKMFDLDPGAHRDYHQQAAFVLLAKGDAAAALSEIDSDKWVRENCSCLVIAYDNLGRKAEADAALANFKKLGATVDPYLIGIAYANRGDVDQAFTWFDRAYLQHQSNVFLLKSSPFTKNVRSDPRFNALCRKLGLLD
jgi:TolB-like protein